MGVGIGTVGEGRGGASHVESKAARWELGLDKGKRRGGGGGGKARGGKERERIWVGKCCEVMGRGGKDCEMMGRRQEEKGGKATGDGHWTKGGAGRERKSCKVMGREQKTCRVVSRGREGDGRGGRGSNGIGRGREGNEKAAKC